MFKVKMHIVLKCLMQLQKIETILRYNWEKMSL